MAQVKAQTMQAKFGFQDKELSTPKHDEIMLWLDQWVDTVLAGSFCGEGQWQTIWVQEFAYSEFVWREKPLSEFSIAEIPEYPQPIIEKIWEFPIVSKSYTIGFCDMRVMIQAPRPKLRYHIKDKYFETHDHATVMYFEVKPSVPSLGEVIRQIRMYQTYTGENRKWFVVSPDNRFRSQLIAQGISFVEVK